jgi:hypothetical protein
MPLKSTVEKAREDAREGKSPSTQAGEFVHEEIDRIRKGEHGARSAKQAIAIGLSEARRAGVKLPPPANASPSVKKKAQQDTKAAGSRQKVSRKRSQATIGALKRESTASVSHAALSRQARSAKRKTVKLVARRRVQNLQRTRQFLRVSFALCIEYKGHKVGIPIAFQLAEHQALRRTLCWGG